MSIAKNARASEVMSKAKQGHYVSMGKFANFGSVPEDSIYYSTMLAQKADQKRLERLAQSAIRKVRA
jgi:hypothetical protein|tara:strand:- start:558 stop:758 length:201 start_codon:yes stop_codon:yes gene_type:complete